MKDKKYEAPKITITVFDTDDIITVSVDHQPVTLFYSGFTAGNVHKAVGEDYFTSD